MPEFTLDPALTGLTIFALSMLLVALYASRHRAEDAPGAGKKRARAADGGPEPAARKGAAGGPGS